MPRLLAVAALSLAVWPFGGELWALRTATSGLCLLIAIQTWHLVNLARWLRRTDGDDFPDAGGAWGQVFLELSRHLRRQARAQAELAAELDSFKEAAWALPDGVVILDENCTVRWCNRRAGEHLGIQYDRDLGAVVTQLVREPGFADFLERRDGGAPFLLASRGTPARSYSLELIRYTERYRLLVSFDVTDLKLAEAMRSDFVANVSHELRTPLTVVSGFLEHFAGDSEMSAEERQRFVHLMTEQSQRMLRLVDDLLTLSRLEAEPLPGSDEAIDMDATLESLLFEAEGLSGGRHLFTMTCVPETPLRGNRHELRSAFSNLISNAIRYTPEGGAIYIAWEARKSGAHFLVKDSGVGIPPEHLPRLTERFYRVDKGRSREAGGTGLGLAIVKHVLLRHQAKLEISSQPGQGSTFMAVFPAWRIGAGKR